MSFWDTMAGAEHGHYDVNNDGRIDAFESGMMIWEQEREAKRASERYADVAELDDLLDVDLDDPDLLDDPLALMDMLDSL